MKSVFHHNFEPFEFITFSGSPERESHPTKRRGQYRVGLLEFHVHPPLALKGEIKEIFKIATCCYFGAAIPSAQLTSAGQLSQPKSCQVQSWPEHVLWTR